MKQKRLNENKTNAERVYALFLKLYPRAHRQQYGPLMLQSFRDHYRETRETQGQRPILFWLDVGADELKSVLREQFSFLKECLFSLNGKQLGLFGGLLLGTLSFALIIWTEVLFPNSNPYRALGLTYSNCFGGLLLFFACTGFLASRQTNRILSGTWAGAISALLGIGIAMLTFCVVDNVFLNLVSQQADKIYGFHHSHFQTMREYINAGLLSGAIFVLPAVGGVGAVCGTLGASVRKLTPFSRLGK